MDSVKRSSWRRVDISARFKSVTLWVLSPVLAFLALAVWAFSSPIGSSPDDDFHLTSVYCVQGESEYCQPGREFETRVIPVGFLDLTCYAMKSKESAACQVGAFPSESQDTFETNRGNFIGKYPPVYYGAMSLFAGEDVESSALVMRLINAAAFVGLVTTLVAILPVWRRRMVILGWLVTLIPLGVFLIPSNNPSGWAVTGVGVAFTATVGWFETQGWRRWALGFLMLLGVIMAAGSRGDAAIFAAGAVGAAVVLNWTWSRRWLLNFAWLPAVAIGVAAVLWSMSNQSDIAIEGFQSEDSTDTVAGGGTGGPSQASPPSGLGLVAYNLLMMPHLWTGVFGTWGLGWFDTLMPAVVPWATAASFIAVGVSGLAHMNKRKAIAISGVVVVLTVVPLYTLSIGGETVGSSFQPRYLLPVVVLLALMMTYETAGTCFRLAKPQLTVVMLALAGAMTVALQVNIRRYVTGTDAQGPDLDTGAQWWWHSAIAGPTLTWALGSAAFAGLLALLWFPLRNDSRVPLSDNQASSPESSEPRV